MTYAIILFAVVAVVIILYIAVKAFKSPTLFFATEESVEELATKLSCPKCRSRRLKPTGRYTIGCENCGFTFSVGTVAKRPSASS
jgi:transposase-like protein